MTARIAGLALLLLVTGCKSLQGPFAQLESAVVNDRYATAPARTAVQIIRGDSVLAPSLSMRLAVGDSIITSRDTRVVLTFRAGYEVTLDTNTVLYINGPSGGQARLDEPGLNSRSFELRSRADAPLGGTRTAGWTAGGSGAGLRLSAPADTTEASIFVRFGRAFIKHVFGKTRTIDAETSQAKLHEEGTEYVVSVDGRGTTVRVISGVVRAEDRTGQYSARYREREGGFLQAGAPPQQMRTLSPNEVETELSWVRQVERVTKVDVPSLGGMTEAQARAALSRAGLRASLYVSRPNNDAASGTVIDQSPNAGQRVQPNSDVTLTVSKGPKRVAAPDSGRVLRARPCTVPGITGRSQAEALRLLEAAGLKGSGTRNNNAIDNIVTSQSVSAQQEVNCDVVIRFTYGNVVR